MGMRWAHETPLSKRFSTPSLRRLWHSVMATVECVSLSMVQYIALGRIRYRQVASCFVQQPQELT